jgi:hypothetical protein
LVAIGYGAGASRYGVAIGQSTYAAVSSIALGLNSSVTGSTSLGIGLLSNIAHTNAMGFGSRATSTANGDIIFATELQNPTIRTQRFDGSTNISYLFAGASTWIDSTAATKRSRFTLSTYYTTSEQEAIRIDSASDLARVGIGGAASGRLCVYAGAAANKGIVVQAATSQTANLQEWQDSAGNSLIAVVPGATLVFAANTPNISGTVSNLVTSGSYYVRLNCTWSGSALTGIAPPTGLSHVDGKIMRLYNAGTQPMKLTNMATSTATNRFACYNSGDLWMSVGDYYECIYDTIAFNGTSSGGAWRVNA